MFVLVMGGLSSCGPETLPAKPTPTPVAAPVTPAAPAWTPPPSLEPRGAKPAQESLAACGADRLQDLIGKPKTQIPVPVDLSKRRVLCSTCVATLDFVPDRLNIIFDAKTGLVTELKCG